MNKKNSYTDYINKRHRDVKYEEFKDYLRKFERLSTRYGWPSDKLLMRACECYREFQEINE